MPQLVPLLAKIANGGATTVEVDLRAYKWRGLIAPTGWTAARLTAATRCMVGSRNDGTTTPPTAVPPPAATFATLGGVVDAAGTLVVFAVDAALQVPGQAVLFTGAVRDAAEAVSLVTLRSTAAAGVTAVNQGADRYLLLLAEPRT